MSKQPKIIVVRESWIESAKRDLFSVACAFAIIGPGVLVDSSAMQWFGFLLAMIVIFTRAAGLRKKMTVSLDEAIEQIDQLKAEASND
ncbi:hypothetical protein [uncultured Ruegeria sp.]|uniref:hypothetical protein n=1 Tax=uncultured Ruegeria sp. TaxID=259304 RepID=UPI002639165E|nr:hypothetical protein [uncultured Ruegeria sp.]